MWSDGERNVGFRLPKAVSRSMSTVSRSRCRTARRSGRT
ncbi:hypothetical protein MINT15_32070 [Saccharomonospora viridis]|uniref:Uncharacterized protein n=1 Tax=Saccharomonospora viridis TaxID=1852 RepID=A0A837D708_9PSEU|nr:hypothetical protein MINT15_32070 [Saccharomonospora viridis]